MEINWKRILLILGIITISICIDQYTKLKAKEHLEAKEGYTYLSDTFRLTFVENRGAFLSMGADLSKQLQYWVLKVFPVIVLIGLFGYTVFSKVLSQWQIIAFSFVLGGGISNIYDRLLFGKVVDFMNMGIGTVRTGIFNFADVSIMIGLFMMLPLIFRKTPKEEIKVETES